MRIGVFGAAGGEFPDNVKERAREIGREIVRRGHVLITGACPGLPQEAVLGAAEIGGRCEGFSPATDIEEHKRLNFPAEGFSNISFLSKEQTNDYNMSFKYRNILSVLSVDAGIIIGGRTGTLNEFTLLFDCGKNIGVWDESGGISNRVIKNLVEDIDKSNGSGILFDKDPFELVRRLEELMK